MEGVLSPTFLEDLGSVDLHDARVSVFIFLAVTHDERGWLPSVKNCRSRRIVVIYCGGFDMEVAT
jgi:hypothetical protein